jgi:carboxymethylenebutenolidase
VRLARALIPLIVWPLVGSALEIDAGPGKDEGPPADAQLVSFPSGELTLRGFLYKPEGPGPFPAVIWNHGSERKPGWGPHLAQFYTSHGYVFFMPHRHGHGRSPGAYIGDLQENLKDGPGGRSHAHSGAIELHELYNQDVVAAVEWLKQQPFVDPHRMVMSGVSYGGIQTLLSAEKGLGVRGFVAFAPGAMSWSGNPLLGDRLLRAVRNAKAPIFLLQAKNDYSLSPSEVLGPALRSKGAPNQSKIYPPFGTSPKDGHGGFACTEQGIAIWGPDVLAFLNTVLAQ